MDNELLERFEKVREEIPDDVMLVAVSKTKPIEDIKALYKAGQKVFGENKVQELTAKAEVLPDDIEWHMIGHLQRNKVKYIAPFVSLIHSVDSERLLKEIDKRAAQNNRTIDCLLQIDISGEETKFGLDEKEAATILSKALTDEFKHVRIRGLMGMAAHADEAIVKKQFKDLKTVYDQLRGLETTDKQVFNLLSMGMSNDYPIAISCGSNIVRVGSKIFGERVYV